MLITLCSAALTTLPQEPAGPCLVVCLLDNSAAPVGLPPDLLNAAHRHVLRDWQLGTAAGGVRLVYAPVLSFTEEMTIAYLPGSDADGDRW